MHKVSLWAHNWLILKVNNEHVRRRLASVCGVVLDLGCGKRPYEREITERASTYIGVDWSNTLHGLSADLLADLNEPLPIKDCAANTVVSFQVLEHLREPQMMLNEAYRVLAPGGNIILTVPFQWWVHEEPYDFFRYTRYGLRYMLEKAGFTDIRVDEVTGFWATWVLKLNYQLARLVRGATPVRSLIHLFLLPVWLVGQTAAPVLDRFWRSPEETAGYVATARRP